MRPAFSGNLGHRQFVFIIEPHYNQTEWARFKGFLRNW